MSSSTDNDQRVAELEIVELEKQADELAKKAQGRAPGMAGFQSGEWAMLIRILKQLCMEQAEQEEQIKVLEEQIKALDAQLNRAKKERDVLVQLRWLYKESFKAKEQRIQQLEEQLAEAPADEAEASTETS